MRTSEYPHYAPEFSRYNLAQSKVVPFCDQDMNIVVCFPTACGKTALAEAIFGYHRKNDGVMAYVAPYRTLCNEKYEKWVNDFHFRDVGVAVQTGEMTTREEIDDAKLTVMTCESFDIRTRHKIEWKKWIESLSVVVFDEAHMIGDKDRGAVLESALMRLTTVNPDCRIVLLSATMDNAMDVAKWIKQLNGKQTKCFQTNWRPYNVATEEIVADDMIDTTIERVKESDCKTIVFVHSKKLGKNLVKAMSKAGIICAFHNASVSKNKRREIEQKFDDKMSGLDVIVATSTLGAGINIG